MSSGKFDVKTKRFDININNNKKGQKPYSSILYVSNTDILKYKIKKEKERKKKILDHFIIIFFQNLNSFRIQAAIKSMIERPKKRKTHCLCSPVGASNFSYKYKLVVFLQAMLKKSLLIQH